MNNMRGIAAQHVIFMVKLIFLTNTAPGLSTGLVPAEEFWPLAAFLSLPVCPRSKALAVLHRSSKAEELSYSLTTQPFWAFDRIGCLVNKGLLDGD